MFLKETCGLLFSEVESFPLESIIWVLRKKYFSGITCCLILHRKEKNYRLCTLMGELSFMASDSGVLLSYSFLTI
jgi:hypothetical protein